MYMEYIKLKKDTLISPRDKIRLFRGLPGGLRLAGGFISLLTSELLLERISTVSCSTTGDMVFAYDVWYVFNQAINSHLIPCCSCNCVGARDL